MNKLDPGWPFSFFEEVADMILKRENKEGVFNIKLSETAKRWSSLLDIQLTIEQIIVMMIEYQLATLKNDPLRLESLKEITCYMAYLVDIASKKKTHKELSLIDNKYLTVSS